MGRNRRSTGLHRIMSPGEGLAFIALAALLVGSCSTTTAPVLFRTSSPYASENDYQNARVDFSRLLFASALIPAETGDDTRSTSVSVVDSPGLRRIQLVDGNAGSVKVTVRGLASGEILDSYTLGGSLGLPQFSSSRATDLVIASKKDLLLLVVHGVDNKLVSVDLMRKHLEAVELRPWRPLYRYVSATLSDSNSLVATVDTQGYIGVSEVATGNSLMTIDAFVPHPCDVVFSADEQYLLVAKSYGSSIYGESVFASLWDLRAGIEIRRVDLTRLNQRDIRHLSDTYRVFLIPGNTNELLLFDAAFERVFRLDLATLAARPLAVQFDAGQPTRYVIDATGRYLVLGDWDGFLTVYDLGADKVIDHFRAHYDEKYWLAYCDAQAGVFATYQGGRTWLWSLKTETVPSAAGPLPLQRTASDSSQSANSLPQLREKYRAAKTKGNGPLVSVQIATSSVTDVEKSQIVTALQARLLSTGELRLVEKEDLDIVLHEIEQSLSGLYSEATQVQLGQFLFADKIIFGALMKVNNLYVFNSKLISVETGQVLALAHLAGNSVDAIIGKMPEMVQAIATALRPR